jgi:hypothetical protein
MDCIHRARQRCRPNFWHYLMLLLMILLERVMRNMYQLFIVSDMLRNFDNHQMMEVPLENFNYTNIHSNIMDINSLRNQKTTMQQQQKIDSEIDFTSHNDNSSRKIASILQRLTQISHHRRFYVYDDPRFSAIPLDDQQLYDTNKTNLRYQKYIHYLRKRYDGFAFSELHLIQVLQNSHYRTYTPEDAHWFFIPISLTHHLINPMKNSSTGNVFHVLYQQPYFQALQGNRHLLLVQTPNLWSWEHLELYDKKEYDIVRHYSILWNVTIAKVFDTQGCRLATTTTSTLNTKTLQNTSLMNLPSPPTPPHDFYKPLQMAAIPMSRSSFSLESIPLSSFPYMAATYEKFRNSTYLCFYRSRKSPSLFQSTPYRHALLNSTVQATIQRELIKLSRQHQSQQTNLSSTSTCSLGIDIRNPKLWIQHFGSSKFCFVIRGDSPMSRSHLRAVKVGCIPVIVSDMLPYYSPIFKSSGISMEDYSIIISEHEFLKDPVATVLLLSQLEEPFLKTKLNYLAFAQRLYFPDHPQSLFVPALMLEMEHAMKDHFQWNVTHWPWLISEYYNETPQLG